MSQYASRIQDLLLFEELKNSAGRDGVSGADVTQLTGMVLHAAEVAGPLLKRIPSTFHQYTEHDIEHCRNVIDLMGRFIPAATRQRLNALELSMLLLSALLHDVGMYVTDEEKAGVLASGEFRRFMATHQDRAIAIREAEDAGQALRAAAIRDALLAEYFRRLHPERAAQVVEQHFAGQGLRFREMDVTGRVMRIAESHGWGALESSDPRRPERSVASLETRGPIYGVPVNEQYLACCLRLADIMDFDRSRTPLSVFRHVDFTEAKSWEEWNKHLQITGWTVNEHEVEYFAECGHPAFYVAVMEFLDWIDHELRDCRQLIVRDAPSAVAERYQLHLPPAVERWVAMADRSYVAGAFHFQLDYGRIMQLLMDKSLYPDPSLFLRELLQNSLDACRLRLALAREADREADYVPRIVVWDHSGDPDDPRVVFQDNGIGMSQRILEHYFMRVGRSYYRSPEFEAEQARLEEKNITLEAASQFGIGILSCFMVADRFEVETYRTGNPPLHITIEGPDKYFVIRRLTEPARTDFTPPAQDDRDDGPPGRPGTRITVHLRSAAAADAWGDAAPRWHHSPSDTAAVLARFAVNVDCDVHVYRGSDEAPTVIAGHGWSRTLPSPATHLRLQAEGFVGGDEIAEAELLDVFTASPIPLQSHDFSRHLHGQAWLWMLRDRDGAAVPRSGNLTMNPRFQWLQCAAHVRLASYLRSWVPHGSQERLADMLRAGSEGGGNPFREQSEMFLNSRGHPGNQEEWALTWDRLTPGARASMARYLARSTKAEIDEGRQSQWWADAGCVQKLHAGGDDWVSEPVDFKGHVRFDNAYSGLALSGILISAGIVRWDAEAGSSARLELVPVAGGCLVDARGRRAPRPAANRLFVDPEQGRLVAVPLLRAAVRHAAGLANGGGWTEH
ncbi:MAG TPA: hypothetical protein VF006_15175 [Longimicrobium sp.]